MKCSNLCLVDSRAADIAHVHDDDDDDDDDVHCTKIDIMTYLMIIAINIVE